MLVLVIVVTSMQSSSSVADCLVTARVTVPSSQETLVVMACWVFVGSLVCRGKRLRKGYLSFGRVIVRLRKVRNVLLLSAGRAVVGYRLVVVTSSRQPCFF